MKQNSGGPAKDRKQFEKLLAYLKRSRGLDLSTYKPSSVMRRLQKRMEGLHLESYEDYMDYLEVHPDEFALLFNHLLINVTSFFRDPSAWEFLDTAILPKLMAGKDPDDQIRVWSAGCASGQEPYSIAMLLCERLGPERFQQRVKIYASDIDDGALTEARQASYGQREVQSIPRPFMEKYLEPTGPRWTIRPELRRSVIFGRHDLIADAPISRLDLLICRNTLMYFNAETQQHILSRFHFALHETGYLFLGKAEMLLTHADLFTPVDLRYRIFTRSRK